MKRLLPLAAALALLPQTAFAYGANIQPEGSPIGGTILVIFGSILLLGLGFFLPLKLRDRL